MRIAGAFFIAIGLAFCLTLIGSIIGIPLIIGGIVMVAFGGRKKTIINNVVTVTNAPEQRPYASDPPQDIAVGRRASANNLDEPRLATTVPSLSAPPEEPYDKKKWQSLAKYDDDIRSAAEKVKPLGEKWETELAVAYLRINDKTYLNSILTKIMRDAQAQER